MVDHMFSKWDRDHDGILELSEASRIFDSDDLNGDHILTLAEYETELDRYGARSLADTIFEYFDYNHDHVLTVEDVSKYYHLLDTNSDGQVTRAEFDEYGTNVRLF
ncbi:hypothetical protein CHS0354_012280 [Potamilus streckersoni]|uniref:EF-hand domain-containing protein n=1 Tax=Potamilus streckersoni TaxID=2493646 RepID=A0AAE0SXU1_9BIVA|nr:hypothetical protein CHS0354_012280 [Potamilus streckersoni]